MRNLLGISYHEFTSVVIIIFGTWRSGFVGPKVALTLLGRRRGCLLTICFLIMVICMAMVLDAAL